MSLITRTLYSNKFGLANFLVLNADFCKLNRNDLYVVQIIEQYQLQMNQTISFTDLENRIDLPIEEFKQILHNLSNKELVIRKIKEVNNFNTLFYNTNKFWLYIAKKMVEFDMFQETVDKKKDFIEIVSKKFNRFLNPNEINQIEQIIDFYDIKILNEILNQSIILNSKFVSTIVELARVYKEANCRTIEEIKSEFEEFRN